VSDQSFLTLAFDAVSGTQLWLTRDGKTSHNGGAAIIPSADGSTVYVTGTSFDVASSSNLFHTIAYSASTGSLLWQSLTGQDGDSASSMAMSPDGSKLFVTGTDSDSFNTTGNTYDYATVALATSDGHELWSSTSPGFFPDVPSVVAATTTAVYVAAEVQTSPRS